VDDHGALYIYSDKWNDVRKFVHGKCIETHPWSEAMPNYLLILAYQHMKDRVRDGNLNRRFTKHSKTKLRVSDLLTGNTTHSLTSASLVHFKATSISFDHVSNFVIFKHAENDWNNHEIEFSICDKDFNFKMHCVVNKLYSCSFVICSRINRYGQIIILTDAKGCASRKSCSVTCSLDKEKQFWKLKKF
jgi:hypothetical protein